MPEQKKLIDESVEAAKKFKSACPLLVEGKSFSQLPEYEQYRCSMARTLLEDFQKKHPGVVDKPYVDDISMILKYCGLNMCGQVGPIAKRKADGYSAIY